MEAGEKWNTIQQRLQPAPAWQMDAGRWNDKKCQESNKRIYGEKDACRI